MLGRFGELSFLRQQVLAHGQGRVEVVAQQIDAGGRLLGGERHVRLRWRAGLGRAHGPAVNENARDPKLIRARILTPSPAFQPGKSEICYATLGSVAVV